jgi:hypothetical protein
MLRRARRFWAALLAGVVVLGMGGCAATRSTFDVTGASADQGTLASPTAHVNIVRVTDKRVFEANPRNPSMPSLEKPEDLKDRAITARAIARKRGGYGNAMSDILLPEGRTVELVVREAVTKALREKGYNVVEPASPEAAKALPLEVDIQQFWMWMTPGVFAITLEQRGIVTMNSVALVGGEAVVVQGYAKVSTMAATDEEWKKTITQGVNDLIEQMKAKLRGR